MKNNSSTHSLFVYTPPSSTSCSLTCHVQDSCSTCLLPTLLRRRAQSYTNAEMALRSSVILRHPYVVVLYCWIGNGERWQRDQLVVLLAEQLVGISSPGARTRVEPSYDVHDCAQHCQEDSAGASLHPPVSQPMALHSGAS